MSAAAELEQGRESYARHEWVDAYDQADAEQAFAERPLGLPASPTVAA